MCLALFKAWKQERSERGREGGSWILCRYQPARVHVNNLSSNLLKYISQGSWVRSPPHPREMLAALLFHLNSFCLSSVRQLLRATRGLSLSLSLSLWQSEHSLHTCDAHSPPSPPPSPTWNHVAMGETTINSMMSMWREYAGKKIESPEDRATQDIKSMSHTHKHTHTGTRKNALHARAKHIQTDSGPCKRLSGGATSLRA